MAPEVLALAERVTGRETLCLLSDHDVEQDIAVEMVIFAEASSTDADPEADGRPVTDEPPVLDEP